MASSSLPCGATAPIGPEGEPVAVPSGARRARAPPGAALAGAALEWVLTVWPARPRVWMRMPNRIPEQDAEQDAQQDAQQGAVHRMPYRGRQE